MPWKRRCRGARCRIFLVSSQWCSCRACNPSIALMLPQTKKWCSCFECQFEFLLLDGLCLFARSVRHRDSKSCAKTRSRSLRLGTIENEWSPPVHHDRTSELQVGDFFQDGLECPRDQHYSL